MRFILIGLAALLAIPGAAAAQEWRQSRELELLVSGFDISPGDLRLRAGEPVRLRLVNQSGRAVTLAAPELFASARLRGRDGGVVQAGRMVVGPHQIREVLLTPAPGRYRMRSTNFVYRLLGLSAEIVVE